MEDEEYQVIPMIIRYGAGYGISYSELNVKKEEGFVRSSKLYDYLTEVYLSFLAVIAAVFPFGAVLRFIYKPKGEFGLLYLINVLFLLPVRTVRAYLKKEGGFGRAANSKVVEGFVGEKLRFYADDIVLLPDCPWAAGNVSFYKSLLASGVKIYMYCHDIIPISHPNYFFKNGASNSYKPWFDEMVDSFSGIFCVSQYTASRVDQYMKILNSSRCLQKKVIDVPVFVSKLGVAFEQDDDDEPGNVVKELVSKSSGEFYLMVGTIEVRKNHITVLNAFEVLWDLGYTMPLYIAGSWGWSVDNLYERVLASKYKDIYLFIINDASDADIKHLYRGARSLVFSSHSEGFGLPLVESAYYHLPVIASDTEINREVAGSSAQYFDVDDSFSLIKVILDVENGEVKQKVSNIKTISWNDSWLKIKHYLI
tara:strand:+ start:51825 stop:53093 length:1269 start_codon:yes stop_codon:yes gene_type:complete